MASTSNSEPDNEVQLTRQGGAGRKETRFKPYKKTCDIVSIDKSVININGKKFKDTGGGFLLEDELNALLEVNIQKELPPIFETDRPTCEECNKVFATSWLFDTFDFKVCDECKNPEVHSLITKTEAMKEYLLKDCDLEKREPALKFIKRKNPHNSNWGDMKLYLKLQIEKRALDIWGSEENLEKELEIREEKKVLSKSKKYQKQMKELRMNVRSSLYNKTLAASHTHEFGEEIYNSDDDTYTHTCLTCHFKETFEKM